MKEKILRTTAKIISKNGLKAASIRAVCEQAGVTAPTVYHYFDNRRGLLEAVTLLAFDKNASNKKAFDQFDDPIKNMNALWDEYINFAISEPDLYSIVIASIAQGVIPQCGKDCFNRTLKVFKLAEEKNLLKETANDAAFIYQGASQGVATLILSKITLDFAHKISQKTKVMVLKGLLK